MNYVAEEMRELMAQLGYRSVNEMVGQVNRLEMRHAIDHWKARGLDYSKILYKPEVGDDVGSYCQIKQDHLLQNSLSTSARSSGRQNRQLKTVHQSKSDYPSSIPTA